MAAAGKIRLSGEREGRKNRPQRTINLLSRDELRRLDLDDLLLLLRTVLLAVNIHSIVVVLLRPRCLKVPAQQVHRADFAVLRLIRIEVSGE